MITKFTCFGLCPWVCLKPWVALLIFAKYLPLQINMTHDPILGLTLQSISQIQVWLSKSTPYWKTKIFDYKQYICFSQMIHGTNYTTAKLTLSLRPKNMLHKETIRLPSTSSWKADSKEYKYYIVLLQSQVPLAHKIFIMDFAT